MAFILPHFIFYIRATPYTPHTSAKTNQKVFIINSNIQFKCPTIKVVFVFEFVHRTYSGHQWHIIACIIVVRRGRGGVLIGPFVVYASARLRSLLYFLECMLHFQTSIYVEEYKQNTRQHLPRARRVFFTLSQLSFSQYLRGRKIYLLIRACICGHHTITLDDCFVLWPQTKSS